MSPPLDRLHLLLTKGVAATEPLWSDVQRGYAFVHQAAHILTNADHLSSKEVQRQYEELLEEMRHSGSLTAPLHEMTATFLKVTVSYWPGLFHCYDVPDLPRTNNDLEQCFGSVRHHERRATGRCGAVPGLVVRGSVRVVAALAARLYCFTAEGLRLRDYQLWRQVREGLSYRQEARRRQFRFCKDPLAYLAQIEACLIQT